MTILPRAIKPSGDKLGLLTELCSPAWIGTANTLSDSFFNDGVRPPVICLNFVNFEVSLILFLGWPKYSTWKWNYLFINSSSTTINRESNTKWTRQFKGQLYPHRCFFCKHFVFLSTWLLRWTWPKLYTTTGQEWENRKNKSSRVTLTFEVWIRVKVTAHRLNEENICTKLDGNPSMHT